MTKPYYKKGNFVLYQANCLEFLPKVKEGSIDMIFADPPYLLSNGGFTVHAGRMVSVNKGEWDISRGFEGDYDFHYQWMKECKRILKPEGKIGIIHWRSDVSTPRGPDLNIRPKPEQCQKWLLEAGFKLEGNIIPLPPYHYGLIGTKQ